MRRELGDIGWHYRVIKDGHYPAPCEPLPNRALELFTDDVLRKEQGGTYRVMTGLSIGGIVLRADEVEYVYSDKVLVLL